MTEQREIDAQALRRAFGMFATGVTVVATADGAGALAGFTANSFTSVSLDPPLLLVCLAHEAASHAAFRDADRYAVSVLADGQRALSRLFATRGVDKFASVAWRPRVTGAPVLDGAAAWFDCRAEAVLPGGDHDILLGRIVDFGRADVPPLGYWQGDYFTVDAAPRVFALVSRGPEVLVRLGEEGVMLPASASLGPPASPDSLMGQLAEAGLDALGGALAATGPADAFDIGAAHHVVYRVEAPASARPAHGWAFREAGAAIAAMLTPGGRTALRRLVAATA